MRGDVSDDQSNYSLDYDVLPAKFNWRCQAGAPGRGRFFKYAYFEFTVKCTLKSTLTITI